MSTKQPFADLLAGLQQGKLSLVDIITSLNARGPVQSPLHRAELAMLDEALAKKKLDDKMHRLLTAKLKEVQTPKAVVEKTAAYSAYKGGPGSDDKTQMGGPGGDKTTLNPASAGGDRTTINPAGGASGDKTVINPEGGNGGGNGGFDLLIDESGDSEATEMSGGAETTGFKPTASEPATARSRTGGTSGPSTSSWQRVGATSSGPEREVHAGDILKERFYLEKEVGRGGMGIVFKAKDERKVEAQDKNPWVAVKVLNPEFRKHPQALVALQRESRKAQQLTHDNILRVYDFDKDGTVIYMTMEYVDGGSLKDVIKKYPNGMPWEKGWPIIAGLARGLGRAHRDNIVHSDFKPGNVMMTSDLVPKLFDMGIARAAKSGAESKGETTVFDAGELGALTPAYASIEMIQGQPPELIDDIYALGITAYEILTGKHPFNKKNAEQVMKEGMKPPIVPGLQRGQQKTLQASVAFKREDRVKSCDEFLEGMRERSIKDYLVPIMGAGVAVVLLLVGIFGGLLPYLKTKREDAVGQQFAQASFADITAATAALEAMKESERVETEQRYSKDIQTYFINVANKNWNVSFGSTADNKPSWNRSAPGQKFDYPAAASAIEIASKMYPDSAAVTDNSRRLKDEQKKFIALLNDDFNDHVDAGRIYEDKTPNVVETVAIVRQVDPANPLLKDQKLLGLYTKDVNREYDAKQYDAAEKRVATAVKVFPDDKTLLGLQKSVKTGHELELAQAKEKELRDKMTAAEAKAELTKLAANPSFTSDWQISVSAAMSKLGGDTSPETAQAKGTLAEAYAKNLAGKVDAKDLVGGQQIADAGGKMFPSVPSLMKEIGRLSEMRKAQQAQEAAKAAEAEVATQKRTFQSKTEANDIRGAQAAFDKIKALAPNDAFLAGDAPKALGEAYLRLAEAQARQNRYDQAQALVAQGLKVAPSLAGLRDAEKQYRFEGNLSFLQGAVSQPANVAGDKVKAAVEALRADDAQRAAKEFGPMENTVVTRIKSLGASDAAAGTKAKNEWLKVFPQDTELASLTFAAAAPAQQQQQTTVASAAPTQPSAQQQARTAGRAAPRGVDTCSASFAGFGRSSKATCQDGNGPKLVVVPGVGGGAPFAISKYEVSVEQFDAFCSATGKCKAEGGNGALPRTGVSLATAKAYVAWLTETTGFTYRLPTDAEWAHAANAGGQGAGEDFNCVLMQGGNQIKGGIAVPVTSGKPNPWGLVNAIGNVAEWTDSGSARGGHFSTPMTQCTVDSKQGGSDSDTVGLRVVREMG